MKEFLTIELIGLIILIWGEWQFWNNTFNWHSSSDGWTDYYSYKLPNKNIRTNTRYLFLTVVIAGILYLIWSN